MSKGIFPDILKIGKITPIYKKDNPELLEKLFGLYPHSQFLEKIFEKVIYERLYSFMVSQNFNESLPIWFSGKVIQPAQCLNYSINHIQEALKNKKHVLGIFIDLSKAFDTIDHKTLLHKLNHYGIRGNANMLLESYLSNQVQYIHALNTDSGKLKVIYGVHGEVLLGPLLFLIYINDYKIVLT